MVTDDGDVLYWALNRGSPPDPDLFLWGRGGKGAKRGSPPDPYLFPWGCGGKGEALQEESTFKSIEKPVLYLGNESKGDDKDGSFC